PMLNVLLKTKSAALALMNPTRAENGVLNVWTFALLLVTVPPFTVVVPTVMPLVPPKVYAGASALKVIEKNALEALCERLVCVLGPKKTSSAMVGRTAGVQLPAVFKKLV